MPRRTTTTTTSRPWYSVTLPGVIGALAHVVRHAARALWAVAAVLAVLAASDWLQRQSRGSKIRSRVQ